MCNRERNYFTLYEYFTAMGVFPRRHHAIQSGIGYCIFRHHESHTATVIIKIKYKDQGCFGSDLSDVRTTVFGCNRVSVPKQNLKTACSGHDVNDCVRAEALHMGMNMCFVCFSSMLFCN